MSLWNLISSFHSSCLTYDVVDGRYYASKTTNSGVHRALSYNRPTSIFLLLTMMMMIGYSFYVMFHKELYVVWCRY